MDRGVDGQRHAEFGDPAREFQLVFERVLEGADAVRAFRRHVLNRDLNVVEAQLLELLKALALHVDGGGYEVGVEPSVRRGLDDVFEVLARGGFAAG